MVFPITGGTQDTGYEISNSLRFNDGDSPKLNRTPSSSGNRKTFTISCWFKRGNISLGDSVDLYSAGQSSGGTGSFSMHILAGDNLRLDANGVIVLKTNRLFRDPSAWYHYVLVVDTTQGTAANRFKMYINGVEETSFATDNRSSISQNTDLRWNMNEGHGVGYNYYDTTYYYDGYITEFHNVDGTAKAQTDFGEFDDNGVWIPKKYTGSYGTNGFFMEFQQTGTSQNSSGIGADTSGNDNHFAVTNLAATDVTEDTCTNNFATLNAVDGALGSVTLAEGNLSFTGPNGGTGRTISTIGVTQGKWYAEFKIKNTHKGRIGIIDETGYELHGGDNENDGVDFDLSGGYIYTSVSGSGSDTGDNSTSSGYDVTNPSADDILSVALDADNKKVLFKLNGTTLGQEGDGFTTLVRTTAGLNLFFHVRDFSGSGDDEPYIICNFGNIPSTIGSPNTDGKYGKFYYAPPTGFYALCTKRLAEFG